MKYKNISLDSVNIFNKTIAPGQIEELIGNIIDERLEVVIEEVIEEKETKSKRKDK